MKKLITLTCAAMLITFSAHAEKRIGLSAAYSAFDTSGTETMKSSGKVNTTSKDEKVIVPSIFFEVANDAGLALGIDYVPAEAELGSGTRSDDDEETTGDNKASAEVTGHTTVYALIPLRDSGAYAKVGVARASIDTTENLATGTTYGNADVNGIMVGFGFNRSGDNGTFFRIEGTYTDYESVKYNGSFNGNAAGDSANKNVVEADVDALAARISVGKSF